MILSGIDSQLVILSDTVRYKVYIEMLSRYYPDIELCVSEMRGEQKAKEREQQKEREEDYGDSAIGEQVRNVL